MLAPLNPLALALGITNVSFVAQVVDWNAPLLYQTIKAAHRHRGTGMVRILQRCPVYADLIGKELQADPSQFLLLRHDQGIPWEPGMGHLFPHVLDHDPQDLGRAFALAQDRSRIPLGLLYHNPAAPCYEDFSSAGRDLTPQGKLAALNQILDQLTL